jgi:hypothetical protein
MKRLLYFISSIAFVCIITACESASAKLQKEVMDVHDEIMPKMDELMTLKTEAKLKIRNLDSLSKSDTTLLAQKLPYDSLLISLDEADKAMMDWMHGFDTEMTGKDENQKLEYLKGEKIKIDWVKNKMTESISKGKNLLKK